MHRFYAPEIASRLVLPEDESHHCVKVMRMQEGDMLEVVDGKGTLYTCRITMAHPKRCAIEVAASEVQRPHWGQSLTLAVAPTKHLDRMEWMVEKCVEMGVDRIVPLLCRNSERTTLKVERLERVAVAAMKQSLKCTLPVIDPLTPLHHVVDNTQADVRLVAYCDAALPRQLRKSLPQCFAVGRDTVMLIGPEGDFAPDEVEHLMAAGYAPVTLGESRLRTETAAIMALAMCHTLIQANYDSSSTL